MELHQHWYWDFCTLLEGGGEMSKMKQIFFGITSLIGGGSVNSGASPV